MSDPSATDPSPSATDPSMTPSSAPGAFPSAQQPPPFPGAVGAQPRPRDTRPRTVAILALVFAIVGTVLMVVPILPLFSWPLILAGFALALISMISRGQGGKSLGIAALITSIVSGFLSVVLTVVPLILTVFGGIVSPMNTNGSFRNDGSESVPHVPQGADLDLKIVEWSVGRGPAEPSTWWFAIVVDNPNDDAVFNRADITIDALDAGGAILDTSSDSRVILPGRTAIVGYFFDVGGREVNSVKVDLPDAGTAILIPPDDLGTVRLSGIATTHDEHQTRVIGTIVSTFTDDYAQVGVSIIARDTTGKIIDVSASSVSTVPAQGSTPFEVGFSGLLPDDTTMEAYPHL